MSLCGFGTLLAVFTDYNGTMLLLADVSRDLERLRELCLLLPPKSGPPNPFKPYIPDEGWVENTGSLQGALNHILEVAFGCRATIDNVPIELKSHGPDLLAIVDVLAAAITSHDGENPILINWIGDLIRAIEAVPKASVSICGWIYAHQVPLREKLRRSQVCWGNEDRSTLRKASKLKKKTKPRSVQRGKRWRSRRR